MKVYKSSLVIKVEIFFIFKFWAWFVSIIIIPMKM